MLNKVSQRKTNTVYFHLYVEFHETELMETEYRMVVASGWGMEERKRCWVKSIDFQT